MPLAKNRGKLKKQLAALQIKKSQGVSGLDKMIKEIQAELKESLSRLFFIIDEREGVRGFTSPQQGRAFFARLRQLSLTSGKRPVSLLSRQKALIRSTVSKRKNTLKETKRRQIFKELIRQF